MSEKINKNDFIEIEFTGRIKEGEIFDSNLKEDLEKAKLPLNENQTKPFIFSIGNKMFLEGIDEFLLGKETGKTYEINLTSEKAFGKRNPQLVKLIPMKFFSENKLNPAPGVAFNFDGQIAKVLSVSGGRVMVDFNGPLAGKEVTYTVKVKKKVENMEDKVTSLMNFLFRKDFDFEVRGSKKKIVIKLKPEEKQFEQLLLLFNDKFKEIVGLELEVENKEKKIKTEDKKDEKKDLKETKKEENPNSETKK